MTGSTVGHVDEPSAMDPSELPLSIVVCTKDRAAILEECLECLLGQDAPSHLFEVVAVDDGSTDETWEVLSRLRGARPSPALEIVRQDNLGLNGARNTGVRSSRGRFIGFVDDDELAPPDYVQKVLAQIAAEPELAGFGGPCVDRGSEGPRTCRRCSLGAVEVPAEPGALAPRLLGGNMILARSALREIGPFDSRLSGRGDETEWFQRATGASFRYCPDLWLWHRRDHLTVLGLARHSFAQGVSLPAFVRIQGGRYAPRPIATLRHAGHALFYGCSKGLSLLARDLGALWGWILGSAGAGRGAGAGESRGLEEP